MKPEKLFMDVRPGDQPDGTYPYAKNGIMADLLATVFNEPGFRALSAQMPYTLIGHISADNVIVVFSTDNTNSAIGTFDPVTEIYTVIVNDNPSSLVNWPADDSRMEFSLDYYITGQAQRNYKAELVVAFTDKNKFPKYVNVTDPSIAVVDDIRLFPVYKTPDITLSEGVGGALSGGTYYVAISYEKQDGTTTPWSEVSDGFTIKPGDLAATSDKALNILISAADTNYDFIRVAIISKVAGKTTAVQLTDLTPVTDGEITVIYSGDNITEAITVTEILTPQAIYSRVGTIGQLNDALYLGDVDTEPDINDMQQYASIIRIQFVSKLMSVTSPIPELVNGQERGMMHEEVYAIYVRYHKTKGGFTKAYTIPGIPAQPFSESDSSESLAGGGSGFIPRYQVEDTIPAFDPVTKIGTPGVWINQDEVYPDTIEFDSSALGGPNLRGERVQHHKMPSIRWCKQNLYAAESNYGKISLDILGILASNVTIPAKYEGIIDGYELLFAKRTGANMTVYGQCAMLHAANKVVEIALPVLNATQYTTGGNWRSEILHQSAGDYDDNNDLTKLNKSTIRFHAFDLLLNKPSISPTFVSSQLKLRKQNLQAEGYYEDGADAGGEQNMPVVFLIDYTTGEIPQSIAAGKYLRHINRGSYLVNGINANKFINLNHENCWAGILDGSDWTLADGMASYRIRGQSYTEASRGIPDFEETYLVNLISRKENVYANFYSQSLVSMGKYVPIATNPVFYGGDTFVCDYTFHTYGRHSAVDTSGDGFKGKKVIRRIICESASNIHLRYEIGGNEYSKWYPKTGIARDNPDGCYITRFDRSKDPNQFGYTKDLNALNDFVSSTVFNPFREEINQHPYRIHRGGKLSKQNKPRSWRSFLPLDFYEMQKNMGKIIHLEGMDDQLLIHCVNALFATQDKTKLDGGGELSITLGTADIFQFEPQEANSAPLGYAGTQHDLACVRTPIGYVFVDAKLGEIYLYKEKLQNLGPGVNTFLRNWLRVSQTNPYNGNGITIGWDQKYKRIILTVKNQLPEESVVKIYENTDVFFDNLVEGDIINYNGRYIQYAGLNNPEESGLDCDPDDEAPHILEWRADEVSCEQETPLIPQELPVDFESMHSPAVMQYDSEAGMYLGDHDDPTVGIFAAIDLVSGTRTAQPGGFAVLKTAYSFLKDPEKRKIYASCSTDGLITMDISLNQSFVTPYGTDGSNSRTGLWLIGDNIYAFNVSNSMISIIDRDTLNVIATKDVSSDITSGPSYLTSAFNLYWINNKIWVVPYKNITNKIAIYDEFFAGTPTLIDVTGATGVSAGTGDGKYWMNFYYDLVYNKAYLWDMGSSKLHSIDCATQAITATDSFFMQSGITNAEFKWRYDSVADQLYGVFYGQSAGPGSSIGETRVYWFDRATQGIKWIFFDEDIEGDLEREGLTDYMWVAVPNNRIWEGGAWATDGEILKYSHGIILV